MLKTALFDCAINEKCCSVDGGQLELTDALCGSCHHSFLPCISFELMDSLHLM